MITFDFDYYKPASIKEAVACYKDLTVQKKKVIYYSGGTEIISQARLGKLIFDAIIDLKGINECNIFEFNKDNLIIGSAITLSKIVNSDYFPLLSEVCRRAADHTSRDKITIGGNICGEIQYREAVLPLLLSESNFVIAGENGLKTISISKAFDKILKLKKGEFLVQVLIDKSYLSLPYLSIRKTKYEKVDYPLVTISSIKKNNKIKTAFSGLCSYPFRLINVDDIINNNDILEKSLIEDIFKNIPDPILNDIKASDKYRKFITKNILNEIHEKLGGNRNVEN